MLRNIENKTAVNDMQNNEIYPHKTFASYILINRVRRDRNSHKSTLDIQSLIRYAIN